MYQNLYIHVPFCHSKCDYCAFYSEVNSNLREKYLEKIVNDIEINAQNLENSCKTMYIGGGTPTLLTANELELLFQTLDKSLNLDKIDEISIESNPETLDFDKIQIINHYANRISLGVQSFNRNLRTILGRKCSDHAIYNSIELISNANFKNFNIDLIYAIPSQTTEDFENDLKVIKSTNATHFSAYNLTIEEQTNLAKNQITIDEDLAINLYDIAINDDKFTQYEISNYALSQKNQCKHNLNIWQGETLLGLGPAASSFDGKNRYTQPYSIEKWLKSEDIDFDIIDAESRQNEIFAINLRTIRGWSRQEFEKICPNKFDYYLEKVTELQRFYPDTFSVSNNKISLTKNGLLFWNEIVMELL